MSCQRMLAFFFARKRKSMKTIVISALIALTFVSWCWPADAYVALVLHPVGYEYTPGAVEPSIDAATGTNFTLRLSLAIDEIVEAAGVSIKVSFDNIKIKVLNESSPVEENTSLNWTGFMQTNTGDNTTGEVRYEATMALGETITFHPGQHLLGTIEWQSLSNEESVLTLSGSLIATPVVTLDDIRSCTVNPDGTSGDDSGNGGSAPTTTCFIATAVFGSPEAGEVLVLRKFRDRYLMKNRFGRKMVEFYYRFSPPLAERIRNNERLKRVVRAALKPLIRFSEAVTE